MQKMLARRTVRSLAAVVLLITCYSPPAAAQWVHGGAPVSIKAVEQDEAACVSDGAGGAIVAWLEEHGPFDFEIFAQHIDAHGVIQCRAPDIGAWSGGIGRMPFIHDEGVRHKVCNALTGAAIDTDQGASPTRRFPAEP